jgi:hypothetical protein
VKRVTTKTTTAVRAVRFESWCSTKTALFMTQTEPQAEQFAYHLEQEPTSWYSTTLDLRYLLAA